MLTQVAPASGWGYLGGFVGMIGVLALAVVAPVQGLKNRDTPYALTEDEMNRFHMLDKLAARGVI